MIEKALIREEAAQEILTAFLWYEDRRIGLGQSFLEELDFFIDQIQIRPNSYPKRYKKFRCCPLKRFPFVIYFENGFPIVIYSVFHTSRIPWSWDDN